MKLKRRIPIVPAVISVLLTIAGVWWYANFERASERVHTGLQGKARDDPYLAAKRLLSASGIAVTETSASASASTKFDALPATGTLLLGDRRHLLMTPARVQKIVAWVDGGGHLIVEAEFPGRPDALLTALGLTRMDLVRPKPPANSAPEPKSEPRRTRRPPTMITEVGLPGEARPLKVEFGAYQSLGDPKSLAQWKAADPSGLRLVSFTRGAGRVTASSNLDWMIYRGTSDTDDPGRQPAHIGKFDNAELLVRLVRQNPAHAVSPLRLVWGDDEVSLWSWLTEHAWMAMAAACVLMVLWLWRVAPRFGPLEAEAAPAEQRLIRHVEATGRFYWKHLSPPAVYSTLHDAFMHRLAERRPGLAQRERGARNAELAQLVGARPEAVARALDAPVRSAGEFIRNTVLLQRLSQKL